MRWQAPSAGPGWIHEARLWRRGYSPVAGIDEAGRGALAGPVVAAAVILPRGNHPFRDSKSLPRARRERLAAQVRGDALAWAVGMATASEVDRLNVLRATHLAAARALAALGTQAAGLVTDYLRLRADTSCIAIPRAEEASLQVAAASILAKTWRDTLMVQLDDEHPEYGFARHKGYGTREHLTALARLGPSPAHRLSFGSVVQGSLFPP